MWTRDSADVTSPMHRRRSLLIHRSPVVSWHVTVLAVIVLAAAIVPIPQGAQAQSAPGPAEREALARVITTWNAGCSGHRRTSWDDMVQAWYWEITNSLSPPYGHGSKHWDLDGFFVNGNIVDSDFIDRDLAAWGRDDFNDHPDDVDAIMAGLHGGHDPITDSWRGTVRVDEAGPGDCKAVQAQMELGDRDLEFLHLSSCHSMCRQNWGQWRSSFAGLHQVLGFYGIMYIGQAYIHRYDDFADDAFYVGMASAWIDNLYAADLYKDHVDECPVSMAVDASKSNVVNRAMHEQYDWEYSDPANKSHRWFMFVRGCDPRPDGDATHGPLN